MLRATLVPAAEAVRGDAACAACPYGLQGCFWCVGSSTWGLNVDSSVQLKPQTSHPRYRFAGVEVDPASFVVRVDGQPRECSRKAFELLVVLVRNADRVMSRDAVMDALWPGGQVVSDEALTQLVFRTRAVLGPYGPLLKTLRGIGLRLDAEVTQADGERLTSGDPVADGEHAGAPAAASLDSTPTKPVMAALAAPSSSVSAAPADSAAATRRPAYAATLVAALLITAAGLWSWRGGPASRDLDEGYGLYVADARVSRDDSVALITEALHNDARGERARGALTLEQLHSADHTTPVPALMLAIWNNGDGHGDAASRWLSQARERVGSDTDPYLNFMLEYARAELDGTPQRIIDSAGAVLNVRPRAWRMHLARAHLMEASGMRTAALQEIQKIDVPALGHRRRDMAIADRASMGDVDGASALLDRLDPADDPPMHDFLGGRIAWSRGDFAAAEAGFSRAAATALDAARVDLRMRSLQYAGAIQAMRGDDETARATLEAARTVYAGRSVFIDIDLSLMLAQLHAAAGRDDEMDRELDRALATPLDETNNLLPLTARFTALRLRPTQALPRPSRLTPATAALWDAYVAWQQQRPEAVAAALALADQYGIGSTRLADEARWLQLRAGLRPDPAASLDPPRAPMARVMVRRLIRAELARQGVTLPAQP